MLIDTHCHIHETDYPLDQLEVLMRAHDAGVEKIIAVGTSQLSSEAALSFSAKHSDVYASIGVHPHDTKDGWAAIAGLISSGKYDTTKLVAIGEVGLDYFYTHSPREVQNQALEAQIDIAMSNNLPLIFHVREAFADFWPIFDNFHGIRGVLHSFTDSATNLEAGLTRGLMFGVNGISTFTRDPQQQAMYASIPLENMLLETDAPFLTPTPFRGKVNEPAFVRNVAEHHALIRGLTIDQIATATSTNAHALFAL